MALIAQNKQSFHTYKRKYKKSQKCGFYDEPTHAQSPMTEPRHVLITFSCHQMHDMASGLVQWPRFVCDQKFLAAIQQPTCIVNSRLLDGN
jgi:hypothetical protein